MNYISPIVDSLSFYIRLGIQLRFDYYVVALSCLAPMPGKLFLFNLCVCVCVILERLFSYHFYFMKFEQVKFR